RRCRALRTPWQSPRALCGTPGCRSFRMPRELDFHRLADQSLGCICGLHEELGSRRISAAISVGRIELEFPNATDPVASHEVASDPFVEGAIELLHGIPPQFDCPVCRHKRSAASAIWLKSSAPRSCPSPRASIASRRSRETTSGPSRSKRSRANPSQNESSSLLDTGRAPPRSGPLPNHAGRGPEERMPANTALYWQSYLDGQMRQCL